MAFRVYKAGYHNREENETTAPKPTMPVQSMSVVTATFKKFLAENPWIADVPENGKLLADFIEEHADGYYTLEGLRSVAEILKNKIVRTEPPAPPSEPALPEPFDYAALTDVDELPLDTPIWRQKKATAVQLHSLVRRQQAAKKR